MVQNTVVEHVDRRLDEILVRLNNPLMAQSVSVSPTPCVAVTPPPPLPMSASLIPAASVPVGSEAGERLRSLVIGEKVISFYASEVPDPPAISFATNLARLNSLWDEAYAKPSEHPPVLFIKGEGIPIVYWPDVFKYTGGRKWEGIKHEYFTWKVCFF
jgi:hypothetical protein